MAYLLRPVEYPPKARIHSAGDKIQHLLLLREGRVRVVHKVEGVMLASLGPRELVGIEAFRDRLSERLGLAARGSGGDAAGTRRGGAGESHVGGTRSKAKQMALPGSGTARFHAVAETSIRGYTVGLDDVLKFCTGGHGLKTKSVVEGLVSARQNLRRAHFHRARRHQRALLKARTRTDSHFPDSFRSYADVVLARQPRADDAASVASSGSRVSFASVVSRGASSVAASQSPGTRRPHVPIAAISAASASGSELPCLPVVPESERRCPPALCGMRSGGLARRKSESHSMGNSFAGAAVPPWEHARRRGKRTPATGLGNSVTAAEPLRPGAEHPGVAYRGTTLPAVLVASRDHGIDASTDQNPTQDPADLSFFPKWRRCDSDTRFKMQAARLRDELLESERRLGASMMLSEQAKASFLKQAQKRIFGGAGGGGRGGGASL